ncbi:MAG: BrnT family toxin [Spirochaetota bacterium]
MEYSPFSGVVEFEWDDHNTDKNRNKHSVEPGECEELFFNAPLVVSPDEGHSTLESRYHALGCSDCGRALMLVFTMRNQRIRVISARDQSRKERLIYESRKKAGS